MVEVVEEVRDISSKLGVCKVVYSPWFRLMIRGTKLAQWCILWKRKGYLVQKRKMVDLSNPAWRKVFDKC
jgi:hypothetical protein